MNRRPATLLCAVASVVVIGVSQTAHATSDNSPSLASFQPALRLGSHRSLVADWQQVLNEWLRTVGASLHPRRADVLLRTRLGGRLQADGFFGPATLIATKQWQRDAYVRANGVVTWRTWLTWISGNVTCCGAGYPNFTAIFSRQPEPNVGWWQVAVDRWLAQHKARPILITGRYDTTTRAATARFQRSVGLRPSGIATEATWLEMRKVPGALALP